MPPVTPRNPNQPPRPPQGPQQPGAQPKPAETGTATDDQAGGDNDHGYPLVSPVSELTTAVAELGIRAMAEGMIKTLGVGRDAIGRVLGRIGEELAGG